VHILVVEMIVIYPVANLEAYQKSFFVELELYGWVVVEKLLQFETENEVGWEHGGAVSGDVEVPDFRGDIRKVRDATFFEDEFCDGVWNFPGPQIVGPVFAGGRKVSPAKVAMGEQENDHL
jgi:hypothetical protein